MRRMVVLAGLYLFAAAAHAQQSQDFVLTESAFDVGGTMLSAPGYQITMGAAGLALPGASSLTGPSFSMDGGFLTLVRPAGEVTNVQFTDRSTLVWDPEGVIGDYDVYRGIVSHPFDASYGSCFMSELSMETATDAMSPAIGGSSFYLVTARNRLGEEGTKGFDSAGAERANPAPCP